MNFPGVDADALPFLSRKIVEHMGKKYTAKVRKQFRNYGYGDAGASKAPARVISSAAITFATNLCPMRPAAPTTATLIIEKLLKSKNFINQEP